MPYNFKKTAETPYPKMLEDNVKQYGLDKNESKLYDKMLEDGREGNEDFTDGGSLVTEKQLNKDQKTADYEITEKKLNSESTDLNEFSTSFRNDKGAHPMDYSKEGEKAEKKAYNAAENKKRDKRKMDEIAGEQMIGEKTTIVNNEYKSQLLSNYDSREEFFSKNKMAKKASTDLYAADAYLFAIYKIASDEGRELTLSERTAIDDINNTKIKILAQMADAYDDPDTEIQAEEYERERAIQQLSNELKEQEMEQYLNGVEEKSAFDPEGFDPEGFDPEGFDPSMEEEGDEAGFYDQLGDITEDEDYLDEDLEDEGEVDFYADDNDYLNEERELGLDGNNDPRNNSDEENRYFASVKDVKGLVKTANEVFLQKGSDTDASLKMANQFIQKLVKDFGYDSRQAEELFMKEILEY